MAITDIGYEMVAVGSDRGFWCMDVILIAGTILTTSILLQFITAFLALRLIRVTGTHIAWVSIATALLFMAVRRCISLFRLISGDVAYQPDPVAELVALVTSVLLLVGVAWIAPIFLSITRSEEAMQKSETRLSNAQRIAHIGNWDWNIITNEIYWSDEIYRIFGLPPHEFCATYEAFLNSVHPDDLERVKNSVDEALRENKTYHIDHRIVLPDGEVRTVHEHAEVIVDESGKPIHMVGTVQDITERKLAEERIKHLNSVLNAIRNVNQLIVTVRDRDSLLRKACDVLIDARGYDMVWLGSLSDGETFDTVVGSGFAEDVDRFCESVMAGNHPPCIKKALAQEDIIIIADKSEECEDCFFASSCLGKEAAIIRVKHAGRLFGLLAISRVYGVAVDEDEKKLLEEVASDIALALRNMEMEEAHKAAEDRVKASLKEKEVLLREIHHRVKNNLQVVSSLLDMQARRATNKDIIDVLTESKDRINAMALIHAQLYESSDLSEINMKGFVNKLLMQLLQSYQVQGTKITPVVSVADYPIPISMAVPVGLIVNELLSNALKHAFVGRNEGKIEVRLTASEEGRINLTVSDNGVGLPAGFDIDKTGTLGLRLIKILTEDQLHGTLEVISEDGATFNIEFNIRY